MLTHLRASEVRIKLMEMNNDRLLAFVSVIINDVLVIRDMKLIEGDAGIFLSMPSRKLTDHCPVCNSRNHWRANFCNQCGRELGTNRVPLDANGKKKKLHADIVHPTRSAGREFLEIVVKRAYWLERERAKQPGYECTYDDYTPEDEVIVLPMTQPTTPIVQVHKPVREFGAGIL